MITIIDKYKNCGILKPYQENVCGNRLVKRRISYVRNEASPRGKW